MKRLTYIAAALLFVSAGCAKNETTCSVSEDGGNKISLTINVNAPETKVALGVEADAPVLEWTGKETMAVLIGKAQDEANSVAEPSVDKEDGLQVTLTSIAPGVFSGEVELGNFTAADIHGVVVPAENGAYFSYNNNANRIDMPIAQVQTQQQNGVFNPAYVPFFAGMDAAALGTPDADGNYTIGGLNLHNGSDLILFNVHGRQQYMADDEKVLSIKLTADGGITGKSRWTLGGTGIGTQKINDVTVNYDGGETIAAMSQAGLDVYASVVIGGGRTFNTISIATDRGDYVKTLGLTFASADLLTGIDGMKIHKMDVDLSTFERVGDGTLYSVDDGTTWIPAIPTNMDGKLAVKTEEGSPMAVQTLDRIKNAISAQTVPVALDLSGVEFADVIFPVTFAGTEAAPNTYLKSIRFPSNVTTIAASAFLYCTAMTSVDLTGITTINDNAFRYCGLETLNVPSSVKTYGTYIFADNYSLTSVYYNSTYDKISNNKADNMFTFYLTETEIASPSLIVTVGPDVTGLSRCCFRHNNALVKIIVEGASYFRQYAICSCENLAVLEYRCTDTEQLTSSRIGFASVHANNNTEEYPGNNLDASERKLIVPAGMAEVYGPLLTKMIDPYGYTIVEAPAAGN